MARKAVADKRNKTRSSAMYISFWKLMQTSDTFNETRVHPNKKPGHAMYTSFLNVCRQVILLHETPVSTNQTTNAYNESDMCRQN